MTGYVSNNTFEFIPALFSVPSHTIAHHRNLHQYYNFSSLVDNVLCCSYHPTLLYLDTRLHHYFGIRSFCHSYVCIIAVVDDDE